MPKLKGKRHQFSFVLSAAKLSIRTGKELARQLTLNTGLQSASDRVAYANAETSARTAKSGLWSDPKPMPPWDWRHGGKDEPTAQSTVSGCPCGGESYCTRPRGGQYCIAPNGKKKY